MSKHNLKGPIVIAQESIYSQSLAQMHDLGCIGYAENGDIYRYTKLAADVSAGYLLVALGKEANHVNCALAAAAAVGDTKVEVTVGATAVDANEYDEGFLQFNDVSPEGEQYKIVKHDAHAGTGNVTVWLDRPLTTVATTSSEVSLIRNPWNCPAVSQLIAERAAGVTVSDWDVSAGCYGWLKTRGLAPVLADTTGWTKGYRLAISNQVDGAMGVSDAGATMVDVGQGIDTGTSTEFNAVYVSID